MADSVWGLTERDVMDSGGDFGDLFGIGDRSGRHRPTTAGERVVLFGLARLAALFLAIAGFAGAWWIEDADRVKGFLVVGTIGVVGWLVLWAARRLDLI